MVSGASGDIDRPGFGVTADFVERSVIGGRAIVGEVVTSIGSHDNAPQLGEREGLYGPESESWRLNREAMLLLGAGPRSLLMQIAHPLIAEGVDQHSDFRADPWRRLQGTLRSYLRIVFGTTSQARGEISRLNGLHRSIKGPVRDAVALSTTRAAGYSARDPRLALWVHATLVDSTIVAYDAWIEPLPRERRARFYSETRPIGLAFGIPEDLLPPDLAAMEAYLERMLDPAGPIQVTPTARELAGYILHPSMGPLFAPLGVLPPVAYDWTLWPAVGLLPSRLRVEFGIPWSPARKTVATWLVGGWRAWNPLIPTGFRWVAQAARADARLAR